jgi:hypothetical protein
MATKKKAAKKKAAKSKVSDAVLRFNPRWFADPPPDIFRRVDPRVLREINQLKAQFTKQVNAVLKRG